MQAIGVARYLMIAKIQILLISLFIFIYGCDTPIDNARFTESETSTVDISKVPIKAELAFLFL
jgi:hypothetical protein